MAMCSETHDFKWLGLHHNGFLSHRAQWRMGSRCCHSATAEAWVSLTQWLISTHETLWDMLKNTLLKNRTTHLTDLTTSFLILKLTGMTISTSSTSKYILLISVFVYLRANSFVIYWFLSNFWTVKIYKIYLSVVYQNFRFSEWCCHPWMINVWHTNPTLRNLCCLTYSSSFLSPPPTHYHPTLFWSSYKQR